jgi:hypothetical protein
VTAEAPATTCRGNNSQFADLYHASRDNIFRPPAAIEIGNSRLAIPPPSCFSFQEVRYFFRTENVRHYLTPTLLNYYVCIFPNKTGRHLCWIKTQRFIESDFPIDLDYSNCALIRHAAIKCPQDSMDDG